MSEYFSHDYDASGDPNIIPLIRNMGAEGYGIFWLIVEKLYREDGVLPENYDDIGFDIHIEPKKVEQIVKGFNLFYIEDGRIRSHSIDRRLEARNEKSEKARQSAYARYSIKKPVQGAQKTPAQREPIRFSKPSAQEVTEYAKTIGFSIDGGRFCDYYESKGWKIGNSPMKDWRAAVRTWKAKDGGASAIVSAKPKPPQCSECWGLSNVSKRKRTDGTEWIVCLDCFTTFKERMKEKDGDLKPIKPSEILGRK